MLQVHSHTLTSLQKWTILVTLGLGAIAFGGLIYTYERHHRGPTDAIFLGTWKVSFEGLSESVPDTSWYYSFGRDHTYQMFFRSPGIDPFVGETGTWFAGGEFLYLRIPPDPESHAPLVPWHIDMLSPTEVRVHSGSDERLFTRVDPGLAPASNRAMERTADRRALHF